MLPRAKRGSVASNGACFWSLLRGRLERFADVGDVAAGGGAVAALVAFEPGNEEAAFGAADGDVEQAVLFAEAAFAFAARAGEVVVDGHSDEDDGELEAFGLVDGEDGELVVESGLAVEVG